MPTRTPVILLACTTLVLVGLCAYLRRELAHERSRAEAAEHVQAELKGHVEELEMSRDGLLTSINAVRVQAREPLTPPGTIASPAAAAAAAAPLSTVRPRPIELTIAQRRGFLRQRFGKLFKQLSLPESQAEALLDMIAAQEQRAPASGAAMLGNPNPSPEERERNRREIETLVGPEVATKIDDWQERAMSRLNLRSVRDELEELGAPLSEEQKNSLKERLQELPARPFLPKRSEGESNEAYSQRFREWRQESRQQLRDAVTPVLTPEQRKYYNELQESQASMENRAFLAPPPPPPSSGAAGSSAPAHR